MNKTTILLTILFQLFLTNVSKAGVFGEFEYSVENSETTITKYLGSSSHVEIPSTINNMPVTIVGKSAFDQNLSLNSVVIPNGVREIGNRAFYSCRYLSSVELGNKVDVIDGAAFMYCSSLRFIELPDSLLYINGSAFMATGLKSISIPKNVKSMVLSSMFLWSGICAVNVSPENERFASRDGVLYNKDYSILLYSPEGKMEVTIPDSVVRLEKHSFRYSSIKSIVIPSSVTSLGIGSFFQCRYLESVIIGDGVVGIEAGVFGDCGNIKSITLGESVTNVSLPLTTATYYTTEVLLDTINVSSNNKNFRSNDGVLFSKDLSTLVSVPEASLSQSYTVPNSVTSIGDKALFGCKGLQSITIPSGVISIGDEAFSYCSSLNSILIPNSVLSIGIEAFNGCDSLLSVEPDSEGRGYRTVDGVLFNEDSSILSSVLTGTDRVEYTIPSSVNTIGNGAFYDCGKLSSIVLPDSVSSIGTAAFSACYSLRSFVIPDGVREVGDRMFSSCSNLSSITIPNSVTKIGESAFQYCYSLSSISLPDGVTSIGAEAFLSCRNLSSITLPSSLTALGNQTFGYCNSLTSVTIPNSVKSIGEELFFSCDSLSSVALPNSIITIGKSTFEDCPSLESIVIPDGVTVLGTRAFANCPLLSSVSLPNSLVSIGSQAFLYCNSLTSLTIPDSVIDIGTETFYNCNSLQSITVPDQVMTIKSSTFENCSSLSLVTIGKAVTSIGNRAFYGCNLVNSLTIPDNVTAMGDNVFCYCGQLNSITIPNSVTSIGRNIFTGCDSLLSIEANSNGGYKSLDGLILNEDMTTVVAFLETSENSNCLIPNGVTTIGPGAFENCHNLNSIVIPDSMTTIANGAFSGCNSLASIVIPDSVISLGHCAFSNCSALSSVTLSNNITVIEDWCFYNCSSLAVINGGSSVSSIGELAFYHCDSLISFDIPDGVTVIKNGTFSYCSSLSAVTIPDTVESIGTNAFSHCISLTSLAMPKGLTSIRARAFYNCNKLTSVILPESLISIGTYAFYNCSSLTSIIIPNSVIDVGTRAFFSCDLLESVTIGSRVELIGEASFYSCPLLSSISVEENNNVYSSIDGVLFNKDATFLILYPGSKLDQSYFFPDTVTVVGYGAFNSCINLISITIPDCITTMEWNSFRNNNSLSNIFVYNKSKPFEVLTPIIPMDGLIEFKQSELNSTFIDFVSENISNTAEIKQAPVQVSEASISNLTNYVNDVSDTIIANEDKYSVFWATTGLVSGDYLLTLNYQLSGHEKETVLELALWNSDSLNSGALNFLNKNVSDDDVLYGVNLWLNIEDENFVIDPTSDSSPFLTVRRFMKVPSLEFDNEILVNISLILKDAEILPTSVIINEYLPSSCNVIESAQKVRGNVNSIYTKNRGDSISWLIDQPERKMSFDYKLTINDNQIYDYQFIGSVETVNGVSPLKGTDEVFNDGTREWSVIIDKGWNLISVPFALDITFDKLCNHVSTIWTWDNRNSVYQLAGRDGSIDVGQGFWVYSDSVQSVNINGSNLANATLTTYLGWNLLGPIKDCDLGLDMFEFEDNKYNQVETAEPGKGYWHFQFAIESIERPL